MPDEKLIVLSTKIPLSLRDRLYKLPQIQTRRLTPSAWLRALITRALRQGKP